MKIIQYQIMTEVNYGTDETPDIQQIFTSASVPYSEKNLEFAKAEAYNGEISIEEIPESADEVRARRNHLLSETDWTQLQDAPFNVEEKEAISKYRQSLRDIPQQLTFPDNVMWPEIPAILNQQRS